MIARPNPGKVNRDRDPGEGGFLLRNRLLAMADQELQPVVNVLRQPEVAGLVFPAESGRLRRAGDGPGPGRGGPGRRSLGE